MQLTGWDNGNEMRNATCVDSKISIEWPYCLFPILCPLVELSFASRFFYFLSGLSGLPPFQNQNTQRGPVDISSTVIESRAQQYTIGSFKFNSPINNENASFLGKPSSS